VDLLATAIFCFMNAVSGMVTAVTAQRRNRERVNVHLDGAYAFSLAAIVAARLQVGQELTPKDVDRLLTEDSYEKAKESALRFITYRPRSVAELRRRLTQKGYAEPTIESVIARLSELELLDDRAFARYWVEQRETFKPRSHLALRQELFQKGVARHLIDEVVADVDEPDAALRAAKRKAARWYHLPEEEFQEKLGNYLKRLGFGYEIVREVSFRLWAARSNDAE
jgi:regulatory protein